MGKMWMRLADIQHIIGRRSSYIASVYSLYLSVVLKLQLKFGSPFPIFSLLYTVFLWKSQYSLLHHFIFSKYNKSLHPYIFFFFFKLHETCYVMFATLFAVSPNPVSCLNAKGSFSGCGGQVTRPGIIETTNFMGKYSEEANCTWNITAPPGHVIVLRWAQCVFTV